MSDEKRILRARMRAERDAFAMASDAVIAAPPEFLDALAGARVVASYIPIGSEADPSGLAAAARAAGCVVALPHVVDRATPMRFLAWDERDPLLPGPFGLRQPADSAAEVAPDIILTPLVAFDDALNRLGQGAGHYDRAFARYPDAWRLGVAWAMQRLLMLETEAWDVPLHAVATEKGLIR
ncbi:5-formyltetrahydrofolate cyclo-ligase [Sphingomonas donggukensis]|uniref:5-formyltetrahydrofolate cyclo-ligase n=1 Tax=Sphingomonas donggukensis TaxID=2949093 RepID=A0ABY4TW31_9SPHN|nr:5-formyltetrahydrofolate cyclo-ligase [Sphingomonas donggukensis]URW76548.1 5-formyltetrahydrofolate cyclo-ligase [Sphingomonas donggukensis]